MIRSSCSRGDIRRSVKLFVEMKENSFKCRCLCVQRGDSDIFCRMRKVKKAEELIKMMLRIGLKPDTSRYSALSK